MFYGRDWEGVGLEELGEKDRWLHRVVQHKDDQALAGLAGLDEPLGIQAEPNPCSLARTVRKSGTTPIPNRSFRFVIDFTSRISNLHF